ncbi:zinc finger protein 320 isoform X2 [Pieris rapae]|uniref:zinc finger protein 320 isoform X2 n=1 Tax=Pieris rapae TaxID=64459 RepID=UPI001E27D05D|nr:zinc finger protein 320 isoform X2 [Pieris rapae]
MNVIPCRTCLSNNVDNDMTELPKSIHEDKTYFEIMLFCLDITVNTGSNISTKLCGKCFIKIIEYFNFKKQALLSEEYLKSLVNNEVYVDDHTTNTFQTKNKCEVEDYIEDDFKINDVKEEVNSDGFQSDEEFLSVLKNVKYEYVTEVAKENVSTNTVKKRTYKKKATINNQKEQRFQCVECGKKVRNIKEHMLLHLPNGAPKKFKCKYCDASFPRPSARHRHVKYKHLGYKEHCEICNKDINSLKVHNMLVHDIDKMKYECKICNQKFISPSRVQEHVAAAHTKERPYPCDVCGKTFRTKQVMMFHKSHTKEKPYECTECGKRYATSTSLKNHRMLHNASKEYACKLCEMSFTLQRYLDRHMIVHTKEKKYPCSYCGVCFLRSDHRNRHQKTAHERPHPQSME